MSDTRWQEVEELFHRAVLLPEDERAVRVLDWCEGDSALCSEVLALLTSDSLVEQLMARAPAVADGEWLVREAPLAAARETATDPRIGTRVGVFVLERVLGRGGMGVVYLGRRGGDELAQTVAIKVIARHLRGSPAVSQFLAEREALGRLQHEHIARLVDGGIEDGAPYVVMEYVEGRRLDAACDEPATSLARKIEWLLQLCEAVAYVHGHLILHRDLKPGNVMVTAAGQVKLLDFGTLKRIDIEAADSLMTRAGMRSVTVRYASPEYLAGRPVSTATDIYSLGVVLFRVVTGRVPQEAKPEAGRISGSLGKTGAARSALRRDLDAIAAKAMREEPAARYTSVDALAQDLRNALANKPVAARAGTVRYRTVKFLQRHRSVLLGGVALAVTLTVGALAVLHEGAVARLETARAQAGVEDERKLAHLLLFDYFEQLKAIPGSTEAQRKAVSRALAYLDGLVQGASASLLTQDRLDAYTKMGNLLGNPYEENIGDSGGAIQTLEKAVALGRQLLARDPADLRFLQSAVAAELALGRVYFGVGDPQHAVQHLRPAAASSQRIANTVGVDAATIAQAASVVDSLGDVYGQEGAVTLHQPATAIATYELAQSLDAQGLRLDASCARCRRGIALEYWKVGMLTESLDEDQAADLYHHGLDTLADFSPSDQLTTRVHRMDTVLRQRLGTVLMAAGRTQEALTLWDEVHRRFRDAVTADPTDARARFDLAAFDLDLAERYDALGRDEEAFATDREFLDAMNFLASQDPKNTTWRLHRAKGLIRLGLQELRRKDPAAGKKSVDEGVSLIVALAQGAAADAAVLRTAADSLTETHRDPALALRFAERAVAGESTVSPESLITLAQAQRDTGRKVEALTTAQAALGLLAVHPKSLGNREQTAQAQRLVDSAI